MDLLLFLHFYTNSKLSTFIKISSFFLSCLKDAYHYFFEKCVHVQYVHPSSVDAHIGQHSPSEVHTLVGPSVGTISLSLCLSKRQSVGRELRTLACLFPSKFCRSSGMLVSASVDAHIIGYIGSSICLHWFCQAVRPSVCLYVSLYVCLSVRPSVDQYVPRGALAVGTDVGLSAGTSASRSNPTLVYTLVGRFVLWHVCWYI